MPRSSTSSTISTCRPARVDFCRREGAAGVHTLVLVDKQCRREADIEADFVGLTAPDRYLFGWGMDYKGYLRNVPGIYAVAEAA